MTAIAASSHLIGYWSNNWELSYELDQGMLERWIVMNVLALTSPVDPSIVTLFLEIELPVLLLTRRVERLVPVMRVPLN
jgi:hypothetical protein